MNLIQFGDPNSDLDPDSQDKYSSVNAPYLWDIKTFQYNFSIIMLECFFGQK